MGIIGKVGSGKSSLLNALLAEMSRTDGHISIAGLEKGFALAAQEAWIQNATIRDNILFHSSYKPAHYGAVIHACALTEDLKVRLPIMSHPCCSGIENTLQRWWLNIS